MYSILCKKNQVQLFADNNVYVFLELELEQVNKHLCWKCERNLQQMLLSNLWVELNLESQTVWQNNWIIHSLWFIGNNPCCLILCSTCNRRELYILKVCICRFQNLFCLILSASWRNEIASTLCRHGDLIFHFPPPIFCCGRETCGLVQRWNVLCSFRQRARSEIKS